MTNWTLDEALKLIRMMQPLTRIFGYHLCLGGGVMNNGKSAKDLDLYFLPLDQVDKTSDYEGLKNWLDQIWTKGASLLEFRCNYENPPDTIYKYKLKYNGPNGRIDVFII